MRIGGWQLRFDPPGNPIEESIVLRPLCSATAIRIKTETPDNHGYSLNCEAMPYEEVFLPFFLAGLFVFIRCYPLLCESAVRSSA